MNTEALRLAAEHDEGHWIVGTKQWCGEAAAELRRLHFELQCANAAITARDKVFEINQELREALLAIRNSAYMPHGLIGLLDAAIAKAEEKQ